MKSTHGMLKTPFLQSYFGPSKVTAGVALRGRVRAAEFDCAQWRPGRASVFHGFNHEKVNRQLGNVGKRMI